MSSPSPAAAPLPVGFRFRPTDEELVRHYLKPKIAGRAHPDLLFIPDVDLSACEPWELPAKALIKSDDPEWFFFAPLDRKYPGGHRSNRSTAAGYWKATGKDRLIRSRPAGNLIGVKKTLVFHRGRAPRGSRTAWIMHEYRTTEPQLQQGQHGSFVLYRLFNKHEDQAPGSNDSPSTSFPAKPEQARVSEHANSPSTSSPAKPVVKSENLAHLLMPVDSNEPTAPQENDSLMDVFAHLPGLQPDQTFDGFPTVISPMRPYTDHPFLGNDGAQDLSAYFNSIIDHQDLEEALTSTTGNAGPNTTSVLMPSSSSNDKVVDDISAACCSSGTKILQKDTDNVNHDTGAQNDLVNSASGQLFHLYNQSQPHFHSAEMEPPNITAPFTAGSWTPHPQQLFNDVVEPFSSDMANSDAFDGLEGWAAQPMMQQFTASNLLDPQQGTAARRIRLVHSVQRATVVEPVLTSHLESEDEAGSSHSTGNSSTTHDGDYANVISQTTAGEAIHVQDGVFLPTQEGSSVEVTEKSQGFSFDGHISSNAKLSRKANLKQRLKQESTETSQNARDVLQDGGHVPREPSHRRQQHAPNVSVVRLLCLAVLVILAFVCLWKSNLCMLQH